VARKPSRAYRPVVPTDRQQVRGRRGLGSVAILVLAGLVAPANAQPAWWLGLGAQLAIDLDGLGEVRGTEAGVGLDGGASVFCIGRAR
jgi:hypothetical protein